MRSIEHRRHLPIAPAPVGAAYDRIAGEYDGSLGEDLWMRHVLWEHYCRVFQTNAHILDLGCGTGLDACFLAKRGMRVTAIDISGQMIAQLKTNAQRQGVQDKIDTHVQDIADIADIAELDPWPSSAFDGIVSAFAGLNTVADLDRFAADAHRLLRPGGRLLVHVLGPTHFWKQLGCLICLQWRRARELRQRRQRTVAIAGQTVPHRLWVPTEIYPRFFAPYFELRTSYALGFLWPHGLSQWLPLGFLTQCGRLEARLGAHRPFCDWGRFRVLDLERRA